MLLDYSYPILTDANLTDEQIRHIDNSNAASYTFGIIYGLALASTMSDTNFLEEIDDEEQKSDPIIYEMLMLGKKNAKEIVDYTRRKLE